MLQMKVRCTQFRYPVSCLPVTKFIDYQFFCLIQPVKQRFGKAHHLGKVAKEHKMLNYGGLIFRTDCTTFLKSYDDS